MGVLTAALASGSDPDTANTLSVDLSQSFGTLSSGSVADADNWRTASLIYDGSGNYEVLAYQTMTLTAPNRYTSNAYLRRGAFSTPIGAHANGAQFLRLDEAVFDWSYDPTLIGQTVYFKFTSFNKFELMEQSLANVSAYSYTVLGQSTSTGLIHSQVVGFSGKTLAAGNYIDVNNFSLAGIQANDHVAVAPIGKIAGTGWDTVSVTAQVPAAGQFNIIINNPSGAAKTLPLQLFTLRYFH